MSKRFEGKTAIVTGASRGIGLAIARRLVDEGGNVVVTARKAQDLAAAVESLGGAPHALGVAGRADDPEHQAATVAAAIGGFGGLDILVNNAGINPVFGALIETDLAAARKIIEVNAIASLAWLQQAHRARFASYGGAVLNISSAAAVQHAPGVGFYGASKAMLEHLTATLAVELGPKVRVNAIAPAVVKTRFARPLYEGQEDETASRYPLRRLGEVEDIAALAAFLLSDDASWLTGQTYVADGGVTLVGLG